MEALSVARLSLCSPALILQVQAASAACEAQGIYLRIVSALRGEVEQNADWQRGRRPNGTLIPPGQPGHGTITNARYGWSMHNFGLAVDVVPFLEGQEGALNWSVRSGQFQAMVGAMKEQGLAWGGDWHGDLGDFDHFQLGCLPVTPTDAMRVELHRSLPAVWAVYTQVQA